LERSPSISEGESLSPAKKTVAQPKPNLYQLRETVLFYEDPFESAVPDDCDNLVWGDRAYPMSLSFSTLVNGVNLRKYTKLLISSAILSQS
jgi:hypothetical protein